MKLNKKGFTLIELLAVIVVLSIILAIAIPKITNTIKTSKDAAFKNSVKIIMNVARDYAIRNQLQNGIYKIEEPPPEYPEGKEWLEFKGKEKYKGTWKWEDNKVTILNLITESNSIFGVDNNNINIANVDPLYELKNGTFYNVTISGTSIASKSFSTTLVGYTGPSKNIKIPGGIETIGSYSFYNSELSNVILPDLVKTIGSNAFRKNKLTSLIIPDSVTFIGQGAFENNQLNNVTISNTVTYISIGAFRLNQLTSITIPNSVTFLSGFASNQLTSLIIPNSVISIGSNAFFMNQIANVIIPNSVTSIGGSAFYANQLTSLIIPSSVTSIGSGAFSYNPLIIIKNETGNNFNWKSILNASGCAMITGESNDNFITGNCNYSYYMSSGKSVWSGSGTVNITN